MIRHCSEMQIGLWRPSSVCQTLFKFNHKEPTMSLIQEFKEFAMRGNVVDMAVGVIMGGAFGKIVSSLVANVLTPPIGFLTNGVKFENWKHDFPPADVGGVKLEPVTIEYGKFLQATFDFIIVAI